MQHNVNQSDATEKKFKKKLSGQQTGIIANDCGNICGRKTQDKIRDIYSM
jgi:hypothetical protein